MDKSSKHQSALHVMDGVEQPSPINVALIGKLHKKGKRNHSVQDYVEGILVGNRTLLSKAITLVESSLAVHQEMAEEVVALCLKHVRPYISDLKSQISDLKSEQPGRSIRIGITGVPGVGKSTFIEAMGKHLTASGHKLAVLAIDPSSTRSKGSILGDKTRMEDLANDPNAFIRPSPSAGSLGGVARKTRETIILCEAAGFDVIFVETVGVGQSETAVHSMVDFFLLLMLAGAGDELQGIKRGIIEMADAIIVNKADGDNLNKAKAAMVEYANALHLYPPPDSGWIPVVDICSSTTGMGIGNVWDIIMKYRETAMNSGYFHQRRVSQDHQALYQTIEAELRRRFFSQKEITQALRHVEQEISNGSLNPYQAARRLLEQYNRCI